MSGAYCDEAMRQNLVNALRNSLGVEPEEEMEEILEEALTEESISAQLINDDDDGYELQGSPIVKDELKDEVKDETKEEVKDEEIKDDKSPDYDPFRSPEPADSPEKAVEETEYDRKRQSYVSRSRSRRRKHKRRRRRRSSSTSQDMTEMISAIVKTVLKKKKDKR